MFVLLGRACKIDQAFGVIHTNVCTSVTIGDSKFSSLSCQLPVCLMTDLATTAIFLHPRQISYVFGDPSTVPRLVELPITPN
jgi:hypothetical protein